ncbi:MAG TPA: hypothetical protein VEA18_02665 [Candidatus Kapabacteria bacterium]|nr:hypothetical protein [Candidatus Kapabacteria bacterium]
MNSIANILSEHTPPQIQHLPPQTNAADAGTELNASLPYGTSSEQKETNTDTGAALASPQIGDAKRIKELKTMVYAMKDQLDAMLRILSGEQAELSKVTHPDAKVLDTGEQIIEGVFNGYQMVGSDGKTYPVPPNYASKSKLVEGDLMKLTITNHGSFIYKQIGPIKRKRIVGELVAEDGSGQWSVLAEGKPYKILTASVTFYKGNPGDDVVILVPELDESDWGAVENIIHKT